MESDVSASGQTPFSPNHDPQGSLFLVEQAPRTGENHHRAGASRREAQLPGGAEAASPALLWSL